jgi:DNA-binding beta-propeller fold protein YncE
MLAMTAMAAPAFASTAASAGDSWNTGAVFVQMVDHLASQGSLTYDDEHGLLFAVNAGSDTVSVFRVFGDRLELRQVIWSGGAFPVSVTVHGDHAYVLDALGGGTLYGYRIADGHLTPIPGSSRRLGLNPNATPQFTTTPGQVAYTPDGSRILVTTKGNGNDVDVFAVRPDGRLSRSAVVNSEPDAVPFAVSFDRAGHVLIAEAGPSALATFALSAGGTLTQLAIAGTGQMATCWVAPAGRYFYTSNAGSGSVSGYSVDGAGQLTALGNALTDAGTVDASAAGGFLYVQAGAAGIVAL